MLIFFCGDFNYLACLFLCSFLPGEMKLLRKKSWVLSAVKTATQAMRCRPRHLKMCFGKRWERADGINAKRICRDAVVPIEQKTGMLGSDAPGRRGLCRFLVLGDLACVGSLVKVSMCF